MRRQQRFYLLHLLHGVVVAGAFRAVDHDLERTAVFGRRQFRRQQRAGPSWQPVRPPSPAGRSGAVDMVVEHAAIARSRALQIAVDEAMQATWCLPGVRRAAWTPSSASASALRMRTAPPLPPAPPPARGTGARYCLPETDRQEHRHQHGGGGDHREGNLRGTALGGHQWGSPRSMRRCTFSTTTIASSTTRPMHSTSANRVSRFIEKSNAYSAMNAATGRPARSPPESVRHGSCRGTARSPPAPGSLPPPAWRRRGQRRLR